MAARPKEPSDFYFQGFENPTTTPVPDVVFDLLLAWLGEAELKALLYIIRRTFGFKKDRDPISFNQFLRGITTRDGRVLDGGCGIRNRTALSKALKSLEAKGIVISEKGLDDKGENVTTVYRLRFSNEGVVRKTYHPSTPDVLPVVRKTYPQETVLQETDRQLKDSKLGTTQDKSLSNLGGESREGGSPRHSQLPEAKIEIRPQGVSSSAPPRPKSERPADIPLEPEPPSLQEKPVRANPEETSAGESQSEPGFHSVSQVLSQRTAAGKDAPGGRPGPRKTAQKAAAALEDISSISTGNRAPAKPQRQRGSFIATPYLDTVIEEFSLRDLRDAEHVPSNQRRARNLMLAAALDEETFVQNYVYQARSETKAQVKVKNRGAYFFSVLTDLLGMSQDTAGRPRPPLQRRSNQKVPDPPD
jgi:hypothetical protein